MNLQSDFAIHAQPPLAAASALLVSANLPASDLTETHCRDFFYSGPAESPTGLVGLELLGEVALLRSLVVLPGERNAGAGSMLVRHAEEFARGRGVRHLYLLTKTAEAFFAKRGYTQIPRDAAPAAIKSTPEFAGICPASAAFMLKQL